MSVKDLIDEAEALPVEERARLIQRLVLSLDSPGPDELRAEWLSESRRRADELDEGSVQTIPGDEVLRKARELIG